MTRFPGFLLRRLRRPRRKAPGVEHPDSIVNKIYPITDNETVFIATPDTTGKPRAIIVELEYLHASQWNKDDRRNELGWVIHKVTYAKVIVMRVKA